MSFQFIEVSPADVRLDRSEVERDDGFVYSHLKRYCSKFTPLPAITVKVNEGRLVAVRGHKYLSIARELGHDRIRAVLQGTTFKELRKQGVRGLVSLISNNLLDEEQRTDVVTGWHIFFFKSKPPPEIAAEIEARFKRFLSESLQSALREGVQVLIESHFDLSGPCLEIRFPTPVINQAWASSYHAFISSVSNDVLPIESYQGRRFTS
jgi:hypothetical protein